VPETPTNDWRGTLRQRLAVAAAAFLLWSVGIEARLVYLQVYRHADLSARAERQQSRTVQAAAKRGEIVDRRGRVLAYSVDADSIYAVPTEISDPDKAAVALCGALKDCAPKDRVALADRIRRGRAFVYVRRQATPDQARRVSELQLEGIGFMKESRRYYPNKDLASHLLGYVGLDNSGLGGIEGTYDSLIKGHAGTVLIQTDARRHAFSRVEKLPTAGASLELTIDQYLQHVAERELKAGVELAGAAGGSAIVMDPATGEILALANYPTYNPNAYREFDENERRNRAIQDLYEPGSTFKIVTAGAALQEKLITPDTPIDTNPGTIRFGSRIIDEDKGHNYGLQTFTGVIVHSSNVGAVKVGLKVGAERMSDYVRRFGFGRPISPDFRGESPGIVWSASKLTDSALASVSMGYQVGVTPLQMASAVSVVANGGELLQPRAVRAVIRDGKRQPVPRKALGRVISPEVAAEITGIMEAVVTDGTGSKSQIDGYTVAGKTGTASKVVNGRYSTSDYNVSFVGFVPSRQPQFTIVVVVDSPHKQSPYGGTVAAPIFQRIAKAALRQYGIAPSVNAPPPLLVARHEQNPEQTASLELPSASRSNGSPGKAIVTFANAVPGKSELFPDLAGLSAREALRALAQLGVNARLNGTGIVVAQRPEAGVPIERGASATLWLQRRPAIVPASNSGAGATLTNAGEP
jgi:cell division protein FtsI (penicillin-binding protein 3)